MSWLSCDFGVWPKRFRRKSPHTVSQVHHVGSWECPTSNSLSYTVLVMLTNTPHLTAVLFMPVFYDKKWSPFQLVPAVLEDLLRMCRVHQDQRMSYLFILFRILVNILISWIYQISISPFLKGDCFITTFRNRSVTDFTTQRTQDEHISFSTL